MEQEATEVAVILVAGVGERLRPLTSDRPKALIDVGGETMLARAVRLLCANGVRELVVATGYHEEAVRAALASCAARVRYCPNPRYDRTQNAVSLALCREAVGNRAFYKLDGDLVFHADVLTRMGAVRAPLVAAIDRGVALGTEEMKARLDNGRIVSFGKEIPVAEAHGESIGIERIAKEAVSTLFLALDAAVNAGRTGLYYENVYSELLAEGRISAVAADVTGVPWSEIDTPADLERARALVASGALDT